MTLEGPETLGDALAWIGDRHPGVRDRVLDEQGRVRPHVNLFVDREDTRHGSGLETRLAANSVVHILPAVSGGLADRNDTRTLLAAPIAATPG